MNNSICRETHDSFHHQSRSRSVKQPNTMLPERCVTFNHVNLDGTSSVGSAMSLGPRKDPHDPGDNRSSTSSVNIYISSNIQGVANSILLGSRVKMIQPGIGLSVGDVNFGGQIVEPPPTNRSTTKHEFCARWSHGGLAFILLCSLLSFLLGFIFAHQKNE